MFICVSRYVTANLHAVKNKNKIIIKKKRSGYFFDARIKQSLGHYGKTSLINIVSSDGTTMS